MVQIFELIDWTGLTILPRHALPVASLVGYIRDVTPVTGGNSQIRKGSHYEVAWIRKSLLSDGSSILAIRDGLPIIDVVRIDKPWGERLSARGENTEYGGYKITGRLSRSYVVTLHYEGLGKMQPLGGVVIMELNPTRDEMRGFWYEYGRERKIVGGPTVWRKTNE